MKKAFLAIILLLTAAGTHIYPQEKVFPVREGPYFGQEPPGMIPEIVLQRKAWNLQPPRLRSLLEILLR